MARDIIDRSRFFNQYSRIQNSYLNSVYDYKNTVIGYITSPLSSYNIQRNKYNVYIPEQGQILHDVSVKTNATDALSNGVGKKERPFVVGQVVMVEFIGANNARPYITGGAYFSGQVEDLIANDKVPQPDLPPENRKHSPYYLPFNAASFSTNHRCELDSKPYFDRSVSPLNPSYSPAGLEQPGSFNLSAFSGLELKHTAGAHINSNANYFEQNRGVKYSLSEKPYFESLKNAQRRLQDCYSSDTSVVFADGKVVPLSSFYIAQNEVGIGDTFDWINNKINELSTDIVSELEASLDTTLKMMEWLFYEYLDYFQYLIERWGSFDLDFGFGRVGLNFSLTGDSSIWFDFATGYPLIDDYLNELVVSEFSKYLSFNLEDITGLDLSMFETNYPMPHHTMLTSALARTIQTEANFITRLMPPGVNLARGSASLRSSFRSRLSSLISEARSSIGDTYGSGGGSASGGGGLDINDYVIPFNPDAEPIGGGGGDDSIVITNSAPNNNLINESDLQSLPLVINNPVNSEDPKVNMQSFLLRQGIRKAEMVVENLILINNSVNLLSIVTLLINAATPLEQISFLTALRADGYSLNIDSVIDNPTPTLQEIINYNPTEVIEYVTDNFSVNIVSLDDILSNPNVALAGFSIKTYAQELSNNNMEAAITELLRIQGNRRYDSNILTSLVNSLF